jgi:hypothetical protein
MQIKTRIVKKLNKTVVLEVKVQNKEDYDVAEIFNVEDDPRITTTSLKNLIMIGKEIPTVIEISEDPDKENKLRKIKTSDKIEIICKSKEDAISLRKAFMHQIGLALFNWRCDADPVTRDYRL